MPHWLAQPYFRPIPDQKKNSAVESQSEDQIYKPKSKRPLDEIPKGNEGVKKARTTLFVDELPSDSAVPVGQGLN